MIVAAEHVTDLRLVKAIDVDAIAARVAARDIDAFDSAGAAKHAERAISSC